MHHAELRIPVPGGHLAVRDHGGTGRHIVLIHDVGDNCVQWDRLAPLLAEHAHVLSIDLRGHGQTTANLVNLEQIPDDFAAVATYIGAEKLVLVGHHWGGDLGALVGHRRPDIVEALCVIDSPFTLPVDQYRELLEYVAEPEVIDSVVRRLVLGQTGLGPVQLGNFIDATAAVVSNDWLNPPMTPEDALEFVTRSIHHGPGQLWTRIPTRETLLTYTQRAFQVGHIGIEQLFSASWALWVFQPADGEFTTGEPVLTDDATRPSGWAIRPLPGGTHCWFTHAWAVRDALVKMLATLPAND